MPNLDSPFWRRLKVKPVSCSLAFLLDSLSLVGDLVQHISDFVSRVVRRYRTIGLDIGE